MDKVSSDRAPRVGGTPSRRPANEYALLPAETPLPMPRQSLQPGTTGDIVRDRMTAPRGNSSLTNRFGDRDLCSLCSIRSCLSSGSLRCKPCSSSSAPLCFAWIALGTASALLGFFAILRSGARAIVANAHCRDDAAAAASHRSALPGLSRGCRPRRCHHRGDCHRTHRTWRRGKVRLLYPER